MSVQGMLERAGITVVGNKVQIPGAQTQIGNGKIIWLDAANGAATGDATTPQTAISTLTGAAGKITTAKNDQVRLVQGTTSVNLSAGLTWSYDCSHLIGEGAFGLMNQHSRIGHSANFATLLTVSGYGNSFQNLYFMHGRGSATNATGIAVTGPRNSFINCHIGGPMHATEAGTAAYKLLSLENSETYFKDCVIGIDTTPLTAALTLCSFGAQADPPRVIFDNCLFLTRVNAAGGAGATFLKVVAGAGAGLAMFRKCAFINIGSQAMTYGIDGTGLGNFKMAFDSDCFFAGCTDVVASTYEASVFLCPANTPINQVTGGASVALFNGLAAKPDVS